MTTLTLVIIAAVIVAVVLAGITVAIVLVVARSSGSSRQGDYYSQSKSAGESLGSRIRALLGGKTISPELLDSLEESLIAADIGPRISYELIEGLKAKGITSSNDAIGWLKGALAEMVQDAELPLDQGALNVVLVLGVNGVGKTTTIAKIARRLLDSGNTVLLGAADTFRAAAIEQLTKWANRLDIPVIKQHHGADPASVVFDAVDSARAKKVDVLLVDTAGRLHNKKDLMGELQKIDQVLQRKGDLVRKNLLVIDATTGQNGLQQAKTFNEMVGVDGIVLTKYDSEAKGGIIITIQKELGIPFYFIGDGEQLENLSPFRSSDFIEKIFS
jgi:fused signal recognition particle receptor